MIAYMIEPQKSKLACRVTILSLCYNFTTCFFFTQEKPLQKSLQRGEDMQLDQLLSTLNAVAEHCLPSLLKTLFAWYDRQIPHKTRKPKSNKANKDVLSERRDVSYYFLFVFCKDSKPLYLPTLRF